MVGSGVMVGNGVHVQHMYDNMNMYLYYTCLRVVLISPATVSYSLGSIRGSVDIMLIMSTAEFNTPRYSCASSWYSNNNEGVGSLGRRLSHFLDTS